MTTMQQVVDLARESLNDADKVRWTDDRCLAFANDAIQYMVTHRPDLFLGGFTSLPSASLALIATFPVSDRYKRAVADYILSRSMMNETEVGAAEKATAYAQMFGAA
jgi:hypothetical protein